MDAEIKWMGGELDTARDLDVFIENNARSGKDEAIPGYAHSATGSMPHNARATIVRSRPSFEAFSTLVIKADRSISRTNGSDKVPLLTETTMEH